MGWKKKIRTTISICMEVNGKNFSLPKRLLDFLKSKTKKKKNTSTKTTAQEEVPCILPETHDNLSKEKSGVLENILNLKVNEKDETTSGVLEEDPNSKVIKLDDVVVAWTLKNADSLAECTSSVNTDDSQDGSDVYYCKSESLNNLFIDEDDPEDQYKLYLIKSEQRLNGVAERTSNVCGHDPEDDNDLISSHSAEWTSRAIKDYYEDGSDVSSFRSEQSIFDSDDDDGDDEDCDSFEISELQGRYKASTILGSGAFGMVRLGTNIKTKEQVAIKYLEKMDLAGDLSDVRREIKALQDLNHQHVCRMYEVSETPDEIFIVLELCSQRLFDYIMENQVLLEDESRRIFRQILSALAYIHSQGYAHRDLKPDNIMLDEYMNVKLIDFGLCAKPEGGLGSLLTTVCGTGAYMAPEVIRAEPYFGAAADVWSVGITLYCMLCGFLPFDDGEYELDNYTMLDQIMSGMFYVPEHLSQESEGVLKEMLQVDQKHRITVEQLLCHPWVTQGYDGPVEWHSTS